MEIGYAQGVEAARRLEENNIIVNYQASPREEGSRSRFPAPWGSGDDPLGMKEKDLRELADSFRGGAEHRTVRDEVVRLRGRFLEMSYCFSPVELEGTFREDARVGLTLDPR